MGELSETIQGALIGVGGAVIGTILGYLLPTISKSVGRKAINITDVNAYFGSGQVDAFGPDYTHIIFTITILNRKQKNLILEGLTCELYSNNTLIATSPCDDYETQYSYAAQTRYEAMPYIDVPPQSSVRRKSCADFNGDLTSCDKVVFRYSWGLLKRKRIIWTKDVVHNAKT